MEGLKENEKYVKFYPGLPDYDILKALLVSAPIYCAAWFTHNDEFLLTIIKLRLNL